MLPFWIKQAPRALRETLIKRHVKNQLLWLQYAWELRLPLIRLCDDVTLTYTDTTAAMQSLDKANLRRTLDSQLFQFIEERGKHPGCPSFHISIDQITLHPLNLQLEWNDDEFVFQCDLNRLYINPTMSSQKSESENAYPVNITLDAFITHGQNLDVFSNLHLSLASDHVNPDPSNVIKNYIWRFSLMVGHLQNAHATSQDLPKNLMELWILQKPCKFEALEKDSKVQWKVRSMVEIC